MACAAAESPFKAYAYASFEFDRSSCRSWCAVRTSLRPSSRFPCCKYVSPSPSRANPQFGSLPRVLRYFSRTFRAVATLDVEDCSLSRDIAHPHPIGESDVALTAAPRNQQQLCPTRTHLAQTGRYAKGRLFCSPRRYSLLLRKCPVDLRAKPSDSSSGCAKTAISLNFWSSLAPDDNRFIWRFPVLDPTGPVPGGYRPGDANYAVARGLR